MLTNSSTTILGPNGQPLRGRGRPRSVDTSREYTIGGSNSFLSGVVGFPDLQKLHGSVDDMDLRLGWEAKDQMDNDPVCSAALDTRALGATARPIEVVPAPKSLYQSDADEKRADEVAAFIRRNCVRVRTKQRDLNLTSFLLLRNALKIGHTKAEICDDLERGGVDDRKRMLTKIKSKNRFNSCFVVDRANNVLGIAGYTGDYGEKYVNPYNQTNIAGFMSWGLLEQSGWKILDRDKWLVVTNRPPEDDSPLGQSLYRRVYTAFRNKRDMWAMYLKALDNTALPHTVATLPPMTEALDTYPLVNGVPDTTAEKVPMATAIYQALEYGRQGGITVLPNGAAVEQLYTASSGDPFMSALGVWNSEITIGILHQTLATGEGKHMARAAGQVHQDILDLAMRHDRRLISECITRDVFEPLVRKNFPKEYWHLVPSASFGEVELNDFAAWAEAFAKLAQAGLLIPSQFTHIWAILGLPQGDLDELMQHLAQDDAVMDAIMAAQVDPTTGKQKPSMYQEHTTQELSKRMTRNAGQRRAGRNTTVVN